MSTLNIIQYREVWLSITENWIYNQLSNLPADIQSYIICDKTENTETFAWPNLYDFSKFSFGDFVWHGLSKCRWNRKEAYIRMVAQKHLASLLHSHFAFAGWQNMKAAQKEGLKHVITCYGLDISRLPQTYPVWRKRYEKMFPLIDCVLCEGRAMAKAVEALGCPADKIKVQHLGVKVEQIPFQMRSWDGKEPLRFLIAASFREKKGIPYAIEALGQASKQIPIEAAIIGDAGSDAKSQSEKQKILQTIEKYQLNKCIRLLGYQPHSVMMQEAFKSHIFISPSVTAEDGDTEGGLPVGIIEMAASGMPVISTTHCDIPEVIEHGVTGLLAGERDVPGLVKNIEWLAQQPGQWAILAQNARKRVETEYHVKTQAQKLGSIYRQIAGLK